jgi:hypothetical protein
MAYENIKAIPTKSSSDLVWITWYDNLKKTFGKKKANSLFSSNWDSQQASNSSANTSDLRAHLKNNDIDISGGVLGEAKDRVFGFTDSFGDIFTVAKWLGIGLAGVIVVSVGALVFQLATKSSVRREAVSIGKTVATRGVM